MILDMLPRLLTRQIVTLVLTLGVFLGAASPGWAASAVSAEGSMSAGMSMMMPGMAMQNDCMDAMEHGTPDKNVPQKNTDGGCGMCLACALPISLQAPSLAERLYRSSGDLFTHDVNRHGIVILPALPPPIA